jgi:hypothetical protein
MFSVQVHGVLSLVTESFVIGEFYSVVHTSVFQDTCDGFFD